MLWIESKIFNGHVGDREMQKVSAKAAISRDNKSMYKSIYLKIIQIFLCIVILSNLTQKHLH